MDYTFDIDTEYLDHESRIRFWFENRREQMSANESNPYRSRVPDIPDRNISQWMSTNDMPITPEAMGAPPVLPETPVPVPTVEALIPKVEALIPKVEALTVIYNKFGKSELYRVIELLTEERSYDKREMKVLRRAVDAINGGYDSRRAADYARNYF